MGLGEILLAVIVLLCFLGIVVLAVLLGRYLYRAGSRK